MKDLSQATLLVYDNGLFLPIAERLARENGFGRVLWFSPFEQGFSKINEGIIGYGLERVERCYDIWKSKKDVDCFAFFDIENSGLQLELASQGYPVWGSRDGDSLELYREHFHKVLGRVGLDVPKFKVFNGLTELRAFLKDNEGPFFIKISRWRGSFETQKFRSWKLDEGLLDHWAVKFGPAKEIIPFLVFDPIETPLEIGGDTFNIVGKWPDQMLHGDEAKDKAYVSTVTKLEDMPEQLQEILEAFGPVLGKAGYRNFWSMEDRVKDDKHYFGDATTRAPCPATASQLENISNLPEIIYAGAQGELVQPKFEKKYTGEVLLNLKGDRHAWGVTEIPDSLKRWLKIPNSCVINGLRCMPPDENHGEALGWMAAIADTLEELVTTMKNQIDKLPDGMTADLEPLAELLEIIDKGEDEGIPFGTQPVPPPEIVLQ